MCVCVCDKQKLGRDPSDEDCFFDLLSKFQSSRMDDQRCHLSEDANGQDAHSDDAADSAISDMIGQSAFSSSITPDNQTLAGQLMLLKI